MRKTRKISLGFVVFVLFGLILAACAADEPARDPLRGREIARATDAALTLQAPTGTLYARETSNAATLAALPPAFTPTPQILYTLVTATPTATVFANAPDDILGNVYVADNWLNEPFTATDGSTYTMNSFAGSVIFVQTLDTNCQPCTFQQLRVREVAQLFYNEGRGYDIVYVALNIDPGVTVRALTNWATRNSLAPTPELRWYVGNASAALRHEIETTFGKEALEPAAMTMIFVDKAGHSHLSKQGTLSAYEVRDLLVFYADTSLVETPPPPEAAPATSEGG